MKIILRILSKVIAFLSLILLFLYYLSIFLTVNSFTIAYEKSPPISIFYRLHYFPLYMGPIPVILPMLYAPKLSELMLMLITVYSICITSLMLRKINIFTSLKWSVNSFRNNFVVTTAATNGVVLYSADDFLNGLDKIA